MEGDAPTITTESLDNLAVVGDTLHDRLQRPSTVLPNATFVETFKAF